MTPDEIKKKITELKAKYEELEISGNVSFEDLVKDMSSILKECYKKFDKVVISAQQPPKPKNSNSAANWEEELTKLIDDSENISRIALVKSGIVWHNKSYLDIRKSNIPESSNMVKEAMKIAMDEISSKADKHFRRIPRDLACDCPEVTQIMKSYQDLYLEAKSISARIKDLEYQLESAQMGESLCSGQ